MLVFLLFYVIRTSKVTAIPHRQCRDSRGRARVLVGLTTIYATSAYYH